MSLIFYCASFFCLPLPHSFTCPIAQKCIWPSHGSLLKERRPQLQVPFFLFPDKATVTIGPPEVAKKISVHFFLSLMRKLRNIFLLSALFVVCWWLWISRPGFSVCVCVSYISFGSFFPPAGMWIYSESCDWRHLFSSTHTHTQTCTHIWVEVYYVFILVQTLWWLVSLYPAPVLETRKRGKVTLDLFFFVLYLFPVCNFYCLNCWENCFYVSSAFRFFRVLKNQNAAGPTFSELCTAGGHFCRYSLISTSFHY